MLTKRYAVRALPEGSDEKLKRFPPLLRRLLALRGIASDEEAEKFLNPDYDSHTHDPLLLSGAKAAAERILKAVKDGEKIAVWSDYDADGIPGAVIFHDFFKKIGFNNFINYIPHREDEGFGLNIGGIEELGKGGVTLIITVDCGITDAVEVARAKELGIDVIITDHHEENGVRPEALAIVNPKQKACGYPDKNLCGAAVAWKLVQAVIRLGGFGLKDGWEKWLLDMVGLATLSDMVPLTGENRVLASYGLKVLRKSPRLGLEQLLRELRLNRSELTEDDIGFMIAPRLNAASRMGAPMDAFRLFATGDEAEAGALARHLNKINNERKGTVASLVKEVRKIVEERHSNDAPKVVVAGNPNWRPALLGLVANALVEDYGKPVFVWGRGNGTELKGSCRSDGRVDVTVMMREAKRVFVDFGGHREAGGFSVTLEKVHLLEEELARAYEKLRLAVQEPPEGGEPRHATDARLSLDEVHWDTWNQIARLAPFGVGNPKPLFLFEGVLAKATRSFGRDKNHLEVVLEKTNGGTIRAISFFSNPNSFSKPIRSGERADIVASLEKSVFRAEPELRLRIVDIS